MINLNKHIQLETITAKKHSRLVSLIKRIYPPVYKHLWKNEDCNFYINTFYSVENLKLELSDTNAEYYFINYNSKTSGIVRIKYNETFSKEPNTPALYINRIYLGKEAQGKGVAKQVFNWIEKSAVKHNTKLLWLKVMNTQNQALNFYKKQDFRICGTTALTFDLLHEDLRGMYLMSKEL
ncbi:N-acetyltransferase [uncultured Lacinutrix sp.]|uniref:GNAT family N-acetyltransferase n=1 Tax=uncultured Lacinutrix sp. TaxID=574032 RepID=UPI00262FCB44|nr:GNAT family N-acetyltransferase [uncultured Lacinutrix sp.]